MTKRLLSLLFICSTLTLSGQQHWQQHVDYTMDVEMDVETFQYSGTQELVYTNNSPDTLKQVFYHLYYNAFQPNIPGGTPKKRKRQKPTV